MIKKYCYKCGHGTEYTLNKPNFCSKCGNSFESISSQIVSDAKLNANKKNFKIEKDEDFDLENDEISSIPDVSNLEFDEIINFKSSGEKLKDVLFNPVSSEKPSRRVKKKGQKISESEAKKMVEEVMKEGKTLRRKNEKS